MYNFDITGNNDIGLYDLATLGGFPLIWKVYLSD